MPGSGRLLETISMEHNDFHPTLLLKTFILLAGAVAAYTIARAFPNLLDSLSSDASILVKAILIYSFISTLCRIVAVVGIWNGRRWGVYGYVAITILSVTVSFSISGPKNLPYLGGLAVLYIAVRPNWALMR
jgi:hypothetical protein